jgi:hypothetical protein
MNRVLLGLICAAVLALPLLPSASRAESVTYVYAALPGPLANCQWFDAHLNDRDTGSLAQIVDLLYNRAALKPGTPVTIAQSGTTDSGEPLSAFRYNGRLLCAQSEAVLPATPSPAPTPTPSPSPLPTAPQLDEPTPGPQ